MTFDRNLLPDPQSYFESEGLTLSKKGAWRTTRCEFHGGSDSMRIKMATGAWCCMACGAKGGDVLAYHMQAHDTDFISAAKALGAWVEDGRPHQHHRPKPLPAADALSVLALETMVVALIGADMCRGIVPTEADKDRLLKATGRIQQISGIYQK